MRPIPITLACAWILMSACPDPLYLMHEEYWLENDDERYIGGSCVEVADGIMSSTGAGGNGLDYALTMTGSDESVTVVVTGQNGEKLEERAYDQDFLSSGDSDSFVVRSGEVDFLRLEFWGGTTCEKPRDPD